MSSRIYDYNCDLERISLYFVAEPTLSLSVTVEDYHVISYLLIS